MPTQQEQKDYQKAYYKANKKRYKEIRVEKTEKQRLERYQKYLNSNKTIFSKNEIVSKK